MTTRDRTNEQLQNHNEERANEQVQQFHNNPRPC